jgi:hypothetical protein
LQSCIKKYEAANGKTDIYTAQVFKRIKLMSQAEFSKYIHSVTDFRNSKVGRTIGASLPVRSSMIFVASIIAKHFET